VHLEQARSRGILNFVTINPQDQGGPEKNTGKRGRHETLILMPKGGDRRQPGSPREVVLPMPQGLIFGEDTPKKK